MYSSAEDLSHELMALLDGGRCGDAQILQPGSVEAMFEPRVQVDGSKHNAMGWFTRPPVESADPAAPAVPEGTLPLLLAWAAAALALDGFALWLCLVYAPARFDTSLSVIVRQFPDVGISLVPVLALAILWLVPRTVWLVLALRASRAAPWEEMLTRLPRPPRRKRNRRTFTEPIYRLLGYVSLDY